MDALDAVLIALVLVAAAHGRRVGAAVQLLSFAGFLLGLSAGVALLLLVEPHVRGGLAKTVTALVVLLGSASGLAAVGRRCGFRVWGALRRTRGGAVDAACGAAIAVAGTLVASWLFASILVDSAYQGVSRQIEDSAVIQGVERVMPPVPDAFATVERYLSSGGFPVVLANVLPESVAPVTLPGARATRAAAAHAARSTVKVVAIGCGDEQEGSGFVAATGDGDLVVTNAHVVAGTGEITVVAPDGTSSVAIPVLFDPRFDLAVLRTARLGVPALVIDPGDVQRGTGAVVLGYPGGGPLRYGRAGILARFEAEGRDIYDTALTVRTVYELQAIVRPGNSGGPLVSPSGEVLGVVFSRSASNPDVGYALASAGVLSRVHQAERDPRPTGTGSCIG